MLSRDDETSRARPFMEDLLVIQLDELRIALSLSNIERVIRAVYPTTLPEAPDIILGVVNMQGRIIPLVNLRRRFHLAERKIALTDRMVIAHAARRPVALVVDAVSGVLEYPAQDIVAAQAVLPGIGYVEGIVKLKDGLILIHNLGTFLSLEEAASLDRAMSTAQGA